MKFKQDIYAIISYTLLSCLMTYPLILRFNDIAGGGADAVQFLWNLWWVKKALLELHTNPYYSDYIFYPLGANLSFHVLSMFNSLAGIPLQLVFSTVTTYDILFLFSFIVSGYGTYKLVRYLTGDGIAAFIAGVIFAFCPFRFAHAMGHFNILSTEWIPFYVLYLIKTSEEKPLRNAFFAGVFLFLVSLSSWYYMTFLFLFTFIYLIYQGFVNRGKIVEKEFLQRFAVGVLVFTILISPFAYPLITTALTEGYAKKPIDSTFVLSADLLAFFIPTSFHPILGGYVEGIYSRFTGNIFEDTVFLGYLPLLLVIYSLLKIEKKKVGFWFYSGIAFFILSLGPALHILGRFLFPSPIPLGGVAKALGITSSPLGQELLNRFIGIPLPYLLLYLFVPFFSISRTPSRFGIMVMLSIAVLAGYGISMLLKRYNKKWYGVEQKYVLALGILFLILFEFLAIPIPMDSARVPDFYYQIAGDREDYAIVDAPIELGPYGYYQTIHEKRILWAYVARIPPEATEFVEDIPLLKKMRCASQTRAIVHQGILQKVLISNPDVAPIFQKYMGSKQEIYPAPYGTCDEEMNISKKDVETLQEYNIRYIVLHKNSMDSSTLQDLVEILQQLLDSPLSEYEDEETIVYKL